MLLFRRLAQLFGFALFCFLLLRGSACLNLCLDINADFKKYQEKVVIGVAYDCVEKMVYWTEITTPSISKASIEGGDPVSVVRSGRSGVYAQLFFSPRRLFQTQNPLTELGSPEGVAIDHLSRTVFWTDSVKDRIEVASLDGSQRRVIVHSDLVNPRAIITDPPSGCVCV